MRAALIIAFIWIFFGLLGALLMNTANADTVCWTPPTERTDNSQLLPTEIQGYMVYRNNDVAWLDTLVTTNCVDLQATTSAQAGYLVTIDTDGRVSPKSAVFTLEALISPPKPPTGITVTRSTSAALPIP